MFFNDTFNLTTVRPSRAGEFGLSIIFIHFKSLKVIPPGKVTHTYAPAILVVIKSSCIDHSSKSVGWPHPPEGSSKCWEVHICTKVRTTQYNIQQSASKSIVFTSARQNGEAIRQQQQKWKKNTNLGHTFVGKSVEEGEELRNEGHCSSD